MEQELKMLKSPFKARMDGLIQRLSSIQMEEVKSVATHQNLVLMFEHSLKPLFNYLLSQLEELEQYFLTTSHFWHLDETVADLEKFETLWKDEKRLTANKDIYFLFRLNGFRKAGVNAFDTVIQLNICIDQYQYGLKLMNYNQHQPFLKKLYGEWLSENEIENIGEICCSQIMDHIAWQVEQISQTKSNADI
jgi:hypothetical protein